MRKYDNMIMRVSLNSLGFSHLSDQQPVSELDLIMKLSFDEQEEDPSSSNPLPDLVLGWRNV